MPRIHRLLWLAPVLAFAGTLLAQENPPSSTVAPPATKPPAQANPPREPHKFWDKENTYLFAGVGGARMLDYASTRHFRAQGNEEWLLSNWVVDNRPLFVGIELAGTAASIGVSYLCHRTGHHRLERWISLGHIGVGVGGSVHNYLLKPPPPAAQPVVTIPAGR